MYVYMSIEHLCLHRDYSLDCHGGAMGMYYCALENITAMQFEYAIEHSGTHGAQSPVLLTLLDHIACILQMRPSATDGVAWSVCLSVLGALVSSEEQLSRLKRSLKGEWTRVGSWNH